MVVWWCGGVAAWLRGSVLVAWWCGGMVSEGAEVVLLCTDAEVGVGGVIEGGIRPMGGRCRQPIEVGLEVSAPF